MVFQDRRKSGRLDLEATEMAVRSALHRAGAAALTQLLQFPAPRDEPRTVAFVCVLIPRRTIERIGLLDERFCFYGFDDNDYCRRARIAGLADRGRIAVGYKADLNVIDHAALRLHKPVITYDLPAGGRRLDQTVTLMGWVHTNGDAYRW